MKDWPSSSFGIILKVGLIASLETPEITSLAKRLSSKGVGVKRINIDEIPSDSRSVIRLSEGIDVQVDGAGTLDISSFFLSRAEYVSPIPVSNETSVGFRFPRPTWKDWLSRYRNYPETVETEIEANAFRLSFLRILGDLRPVVNGIECAFLHYFKPWMLYRLAQAGVRVPPLMFGNDYESLRDFVEESSVVYKPLSGGREVRIMTERYLSRNKSALSFEPVMLQKYIPGRGIRVYVVGDEVLEAVLMTQLRGYVDNRFDTVNMSVIELPDEVRRMCMVASNTLQMQFCSIDLICDADGDYHVVDCNDRTGFATLERRLGLPISEKLAELLIKLGN